MYEKWQSHISRVCVFLSFYVPCSTQHKAHSSHLSSQPSFSFHFCFVWFCHLRSNVLFFYYLVSSLFLRSYRSSTLSHHLLWMLCLFLLVLRFVATHRHSRPTNWPAALLSPFVKYPYSGSALFFFKRRRTQRPATAAAASLRFDPRGCFCSSLCVFFSITCATFSQKQCFLVFSPKKEEASKFFIICYALISHCPRSSLVQQFNRAYRYFCIYFPSH